MSTSSDDTHRGSSHRSDPLRAGDERLTFSSSAVTVPGLGPTAATGSVRSGAMSIMKADTARADWGFFGLLAFTTVLLVRPQDQVPALTPFHVAEICALLGVIPMLLYRHARGFPIFRATPETIGLMLFGLVIAATIPFSIWPGDAFREFTDSYLKVLVIFVLMTNTLTTRRRLERLVWVIVLCVGFIAARGVFDYARGVNLIEGGRLTGSVDGLFGNPNDLALVMVTFLPAAAVVAISRRHRPWRRAIAAVIMGLMLASVVFTKSRGGVIGLVMMLIALVVLGRRVRPGIGVVIVAALLGASPFIPSSFWVRMTSIVDDEQDQSRFTGSKEARRIVMQEGITAFLERPLTGVGIGQFKNYNPPWRKEKWRETHNAVIQVAAETGVGGLFAFVFLILLAAFSTAASLRTLRRRRQKRQVAAAGVPRAGDLSAADRDALYGHAVAMSASLVGWFTCAMFASVAYSWTFYYLLALIVAGRELAHGRASLVPSGRKWKAATPRETSFRPVVPGVA